MIEITPVPSLTISRIQTPIPEGGTQGPSGMGHVPLQAESLIEKYQLEQYGRKLPWTGRAWKGRAGKQHAQIDSPKLRRGFWDRVEPCPMTACWIWSGHLSNLGYARWSYLDRSKPTREGYRIAFEVLVGKVPKGLELHHTCEMRCCVNPDHLEPVTHAENLFRGRTTDRWWEREKGLKRAKAEPLQLLLDLEPHSKQRPLF